MMKRGAILVAVWAMVLCAGAFPAKAAPGDDILVNMMSNDLMVAAQALGRLRSGELSQYKDKFAKAKNNLLAIISNPMKDANIKMAATDAIAYFQMKNAIPILKNFMRVEKNYALQMSYKTAVDRLEGRIKGDVYEEKPAYSGTPGYYGTPGMHGTPRR